ncbi:crosslink repair DNA glycosylase YcaQ family protein [Micromonospora sp. CPCC 206060]|uniref:DNA glycosylase AlkZ-like family protein n=1 Tax=Micromonospora sp. CPCC 206060 TaxID=3122406 RepID=UPI002FF015B3
MPIARPDTRASSSLSTVEAGHLWNWLLRGQGLSTDTRYAAVADIAHAALGLHAARLPSPYATVLARAKTPAVAMTLFEPGVHQQVTTIRCMRKTLHTLPLGLAAAAHAATLHYRERDALRQVVNAGLSSRQIERTIELITALLRDHGFLGHREIETRLVTGVVPVTAVRLALKLAWERGTLTYRNASLGWNQERRTFGLTTNAHPHLDMTMERRLATVRLIEAYFDRYGPASIHDAMWWSGLSGTAVVDALADIPRPLVAITAPWSASTLYMYQDRLEQFHHQAAGGAPLSGLNFLAHEDVAFKAYFDTRRRYLAELDERAAFNQIGEVLPTIVVDGHIVGTWSWDARGRRIACALVRGHTDPSLRAEIRKWATSASAAMRLGHTPRTTRRDPSS